MSLLNVLRSAVKVADTITKSVQATVTFRHCTDANTAGRGVPSYDAPVPLLAIIDKKQKMVRTPSGQIIASTATLTFLDVAAVAAVTGGVGIKVNDKITLDDGSSPPILNVGGFVDAGTDQPLATTVWL